MEYTKGEWRVSWDGCDYQIITDGGIDYILIAKSQSKANAHLIASAPDLYEACKGLIEHNRLGYSIKLDGIKQALAKAEGS